jgi:hypothetical protein
VFCIEVALTVTTRLVVTTGAVSVPEEDIEPAEVLQVTPVLKLPVPVTLAEHWLVPPELTVVGEQLTVTPVTVEFEEPPPPPQAAIHITPVTTSNNPILRTITPSLSEYRWPACPAA